MVLRSNGTIFVWVSTQSKGLLLIMNWAKETPHLLLRILKFFAVFVFISIQTSPSFSDEKQYSKISDIIEQHLMIKEDVIQSVKAGTTQLEKACSFNTNLPQSDTALNLDEGFQIVQKDHDVSQRFFADLNNSIQKIRLEKTSTYRNNCSIISNLLGNAREKETLCESTKNVLSFLDRLNISVEADKKLIDEKLSVMENLFSMKAQDCVSTNFPDEIYENMQTIVEPIDTIVRNEFRQATEITN